MKGHAARCRHRGLARPSARVQPGARTRSPLSCQSGGWCYQFEQLRKRARRHCGSVRVNRRNLWAPSPGRPTDVMTGRTRRWDPDNPWETRGGGASHHWYLLKASTRRPRARDRAAVIEISPRLEITLTAALAVALGHNSFRRILQSADGHRDLQWHIKVAQIKSKLIEFSAGRDAVVAVVDTGVAPHKDLRRNLSREILRTRVEPNNGRRDPKWSWDRNGESNCGARKGGPASAS